MKPRSAQVRNFNFFLLAVTKFKRAGTKIVRALREFYVSFMQIRHFAHNRNIYIFALLSGSSSPQKSWTFLLNNIKLFLIK